MDISCGTERGIKRRRKTDGICPCGAERIVHGQGYGPKCKAAAQKRYRAKIAAELAFYRQHTGKHRNGAQGG